MHADFLSQIFFACIVECNLLYLDREGMLFATTPAEPDQLQLVAQGLISLE